MNRKTSIVCALVAACLALVAIPSISLGITRDTVLTRGNVWVNKFQKTDSKGTKIYGVPYSQSRWASEDGSLLATSTSSPSTKGYRTDCSGFASLCWHLTDSSGHPYSTSTSDMGAKGNKKFFQIAKSQLQPGDAMLKSTVWGAPVGHVLIFCGWANTAQTEYWCMEQTTSSSHNGTIYHTRPYGQDYYRPYRYSGLEDMYADVEESVAGADAYRAAASACATAFASVPRNGVYTLVIANGSRWGDQVAAASLAGSFHGAMLLTSATSLPASTTAQIQRLRPTRIFLLGDRTAISNAVASKVASLAPVVARISGVDHFAVAANSVKTVVPEAAASGKPVDTAYIVSGDQNAEAVAITPVLTRTARPVVFVHANSIPSLAMTRLKATNVRKLIILGNAKAVSTKVEERFEAAGFTVTRVAGADKYKTALAIANHAISLKVGFTWKRMGVGSTVSTLDALAWSSANGYSGTVITLTPSVALDANVRKTAAAHRAEIVKARVFGGSAGVSAAVRKALAVALRTGK